LASSDLESEEKGCATEAARRASIYSDAAMQHFRLKALLYFLAALQANFESVQDLNRQENPSSKRARSARAPAGAGLKSGDASVAKKVRDQDIVLAIHHSNGGGKEQEWRMN
jgi:hypothetical protein